MPRDGALVLSDLRNHPVDHLRAVWPSRDLRCGAPHGTARRRQDDRPAADARQLPEGALGQHPRSVQCGVRAAAAVRACQGTPRLCGARLEQKMVNRMWRRPPATPVTTPLAGVRNEIDRTVATYKYNLTERMFDRRLSKGACL
jgi:hypothetical protein